MIGWMIIGIRKDTNGYRLLLWRRRLLIIGGRSAGYGIIRTMKLLCMGKRSANDSSGETWDYIQIWTAR